MPGFVVGDDANNKPGDTPPTTADIEERISALENVISDLATEIHTGRLVVEDSEGRPRVTAGVTGGMAELRLDLPGTPEGERTAVVVFAAEGLEDTDGAIAVGMQLEIGGNEAACFAAWKDVDGEWEIDVAPREV